jgi:hypothetical protein
MELEKLFWGVLRVQTPLGPRYLKPTLIQRTYLMWVFRNFSALPVKVLSHRQQRLIEAMCEQNRFISLGMGGDDRPLIGTLEQRPPITPAPRRPTSSVGESVTPFATEARRQ